MKQCPKCERYNADDSIFCSYCAARLTPVNDPYQGGFYSNETYQPYSPTIVSKSKLIVCLVVSILFGGIGFIFALMAYLAYDEYETAKVYGNEYVIREKSKKINSYYKTAWIFNYIGIALVAISFIVGIFMLFGTFVFSFVSFLF